MKKYLIIAAITILVLQSCKPDGPHYKLYDETKEWGDFKENTWWLYEEETTSKQDCLWITGRDVGVWQDKADGKIKESGDYIWLYFENTDTNKSTYMSLTASELSNGIYIKEKNISNNIEYAATILAFDSLMLDVSYRTTKTHILNKYDKYMVINKEYNNVIHVSCEILDYYEYPSINQGYSAINEYWIAKHEGIIKKIIRNQVDTSIWILQNCNIIK